MTDSAIKNKLTQAGFKTTSLGNNETSFEEYGLALDNNIKNMITSSFDCDADYELQAKIASMFGNSRNVMQHGSFVNTLKSMGLSVSSHYVNTRYISDYKAGNTSGSVRNGAINVYTISDGKGGEIVIADANGNAAIEIEEVFMNQILSDIALDVDLIKEFENKHMNDVSSTENNSLSNKEEEAEKKVSQTDYNRKVEEYLRQTGVSVLEAESRVNINLHVNLSYTGTMKDREETDKENIFANSTK